MTTFPVIIPEPHGSLENESRNRIQRHAIIHLVLALIGTVAVETQGLVGHEFPDAGVERGTDGDTAGRSAREVVRMWGQLV